VALCFVDDKWHKVSDCSCRLQYRIPAMLVEASRLFANEVVPRSGMH